MATPTPYSTIYNNFLNKITDYQLSGLIQSQAEIYMYGYLTSSIARFTKCKTDLSNKDDILQQFNNAVSNLEIEILTLYMIIEWLSPQINNIYVLKQVLSDTDFKMYSQAQHLKELMDLKVLLQNDVESLIVKYTYDTQIDFSSLA